MSAGISKRSAADAAEAPALYATVAEHPLRVTSANLHRNVLEIGHW
jgi:hypothetical protein